MIDPKNDHGGAIDTAIEQFGGSRADWIDLSTGINPWPYPVSGVDPIDWQILPIQSAQSGLENAARKFWRVPAGAAILAAPGASSLIAKIPALRPAGQVSISGPTYNEHQSAFEFHGWSVSDDASDAKVVVNPNNPDGRTWGTTDIADAQFCIIDESFCDVTPDASLIDRSNQPGTIVLKSFGKFWGLGGLRLGFAIGDPALIARLKQMLGPWPVSGPALTIGQRALADRPWADATIDRLAKQAKLLDDVMVNKGNRLIGGTSLFRLYETADATALYDQLGNQQILIRKFPYSTSWVRLGLPENDDDMNRLRAAL